MKYFTRYNKTPLESSDISLSSHTNNCKLVLLCFILINTWRNNLRIHVLNDTLDIQIRAYSTIIQRPNKYNFITLRSHKVFKVLRRQAHICKKIFPLSYKIQFFFVSVKLQHRRISLCKSRFKTTVTSVKMWNQL